MAQPHDNPGPSRGLPVAAGAGLSPAGAGTREDSCNFSPASGVVEPNDALPPVHTTEAGVAPPPDFTTFMRNYQDMV